MIEMKMKVGGYLTSVRNIDTGEELITEPTHNLVTNSGIDLLLNGRSINDGTTLISNFFMFTGNNYVQGFGYPRMFVGSGTSASQPSMTTLETYKSPKTISTKSLIAGTSSSIVNGRWHQRLVKTVSITGYDLPVTEIAFGPDIPAYSPIFSRILLKNPITSFGTYAFTYDFFVSLPYATRTFVPDLGGTGLPGEIKIDQSYYTGVGGISIPKLAPGFDANSTGTNFLVGPDANTSVPIGLLIPYCWPTDVLLSQCPMFSTNTSLDFGDDSAARLTNQSNGHCICNPGSYVAGQGYRDFAYAIDAAYPTASAGVLNIAYINLRGLAMRFGSYVNGSWVGQTLNKDAAHKLVITLRYAYTAE